MSELFLAARRRTRDGQADGAPEAPVDREGSCELFQLINTISHSSIFLGNKPTLFLMLILPKREKTRFEVAFMEATQSDVKKAEWYLLSVGSAHCRLGHRIRPCGPIITHTNMTARWRYTSKVLQGIPDRTRSAVRKTMAEEKRKGTAMEGVHWGFSAQAQIQISTTSS